MSDKCSKMVNLLMKGFVLTVWISVLSTSASKELKDFVYHRVQANKSVEFSFPIPGQSQNMMAFSLSRGNQCSQVLYYNIKSEPDIKQLIGRLSVNNTSKAMKVTISHLCTDDSDLYTCTFHYEEGNGFKDQQCSKKVFLFVQGINDEAACGEGKAFGCSEPTYKEKMCDHEPLVFALSAAAGLLVLVVIAFAAAYYSNRRRVSEPQQTLPIYEEMIGVREKPALSPNEQETTHVYAVPQKGNP